MPIPFFGRGELRRSRAVFGVVGQQAGRFVTERISSA
jgi:hypothetical protein